MRCRAHASTSAHAELRKAFAHRHQAAAPAGFKQCDFEFAAKMGSSFSCFRSTDEAERRATSKQKCLRCVLFYLFCSERLLASTESTRSSAAAKHGAVRGRLLEKINACLFISCRFTNLPLEVAAEAAAALAEDVRWSLETPEMDEDERPWYRFSHVVGVALYVRQLFQLSFTGRA